MVEYQGLDLDRTYAALAHPIRRDVIERLRVEDGNVTDLAARFDVSLAAVSKHIKVLEAAGLVRRSIRGRVHHLSLDPQPLAAAAAWMDDYRAFWEGRIDALAQLLEGGSR